MEFVGGDKFAETPQWRQILKLICLDRVQTSPVFIGIGEEMRNLA